LGIIFDRAEWATIDETKPHALEELNSITSVISNIQFFVAEKWRIASDKGGSGNTANIGSITRIQDILDGSGMFSKLGEGWFDDYWMNYGKTIIKKPDGTSKKISSLKEFVQFRNGDPSLIVSRNNTQ
jgi:hypothetical protein